MIASLILNDLSNKIVGHLGFLLASSNRIKDLEEIFLRSRNRLLAVSMILSMLAPGVWPPRSDGLAASQKQSLVASRRRLERH